MAWSLGTVVNHYGQSIGIQVFLASGASTDYSAAPISGGNINVIVPLRGTLSFVDLGSTPGTPPHEVAAYYLNQSWSYRYDTSMKINVTIDAAGNPTMEQV